MNIKFTIPFILSLLLVSCGGNNAKLSPYDKAWAITKGEDKQLVREFMEQQGLTITDEDSVLVGFKIDGVIWCNENWDMATVKFNTKHKAIAVNLMKGEPFSDFKGNEIVDFLATLYGSAKYDPNVSIWTFEGNENTTAFMAQYPRSMIDIAWRISE